MKKVAIVYHYIAHYRVPIFNLLSRNQENEYIIYAGTKTDTPIYLAPENLKNTVPAKGGLRWIVIKNQWFLNLFLWQKGIVRLSLSNKVDTMIFLGNMYFISTWIAAICCRCTGKKVLFWTHGFISNESGLKGYLRNSFYRLAHELMVYGHRARGILVQKGFNPKNVSVVYNSLDYEKLKTLRETDVDTMNLFINNQLPTIGFIGRLTEQKKIDMLIHALAVINGEKEKANLIIIGTGEKEIFLKDLTVKLELQKNVLFYGPTFSEEEIHKLMCSINVIVSPGEVGLTAIHSLSYGVPVITHNNFDKQMPEFESIIPGRTGDFFDFNNLDSLIIMLQKWLNKKDKTFVKAECLNVIDKYYNTNNQLRIINSIV